MLDDAATPEILPRGGHPDPSPCPSSRPEEGAPVARTASARPELPGSHAIPPQYRVRLDVKHPPAPGDDGYSPAADPGQEWRRKGRWLDAISLDEIGPPVTLARHDAAELLDAFLAVAEWGLRALDPEVQAMAAKMIEAGEMLAKGATDRDGRAVPLGRMLGIQPPAGSTAAHRVKLIRRDAMLRAVRAAVPAFADAPPRAAAVAMVASFDRYRAGGWQADRARDAAPVLEPAATWWRVLRLGLSVPVPGADRLADILAE